MPRRRRPPRSGAIGELPPLRILGQIASLQAIYYVTSLVLMLFSTLVGGSSFKLDLVFGWADVRGDTTQGWILSFNWLCCAGVVVAAMVVLIARSKLVLDFALTLHFLHLVVVTLYTGTVPRNAMWWATMAISSAIAVGGGTWGCQWRELRPISFGFSGANNNGDSGATAQQNGSADGVGAEGGDEEMGFSRGRGRGRGRDGAGEYEMVGMKGNETS